MVAAPGTWLGLGGYPGGFIVVVAHTRCQLCAAGTILANSIDRVAYTWAWYGRAADAWRTPDPPITVTIDLRKGRGSTLVEVALAAVPVELAPATGDLWAWAVQRRMRARTDGSRPVLPPWGR